MGSDFIIDIPACQQTGRATQGRTTYVSAPAPPASEAGIYLSIPIGRSTQVRPT